jgi:Zn-dependent M16 (insulinase) family peptidase
LRSGVLRDSQSCDIDWSTEIDDFTKQFFADVLLSWLSGDHSAYFVKSMLDNNLPLDDELSKFPII